MDFEKIKDIIRKEGGKIVIVENNEPQLIVMAFEEYHGKMQAEKVNPPTPVYNSREPENSRARPAVTPSPPETSKAGEPRVNSYSPAEREGAQGESLTIDDLPL
jgi:PHD/YefM family antitoxin component YafN of YafNO toxin-antitoxin module